MTNRTLVLPEFACWCDQDQVATVLKDCTMRGSDLELPFACPPDWLLAMPELDKALLPYRNPGFLSVHGQVWTRLSHHLVDVSIHLFSYP